MEKKSETSLNEKLTVLLEKWAVRDGHHIMEDFDLHGVRSLRHIRENRYTSQIWSCPFQGEGAAAVLRSFWFGIYNDHYEESVSLLTSLRTPGEGIFSSILSTASLRLKGRWDEGKVKTLPGFAMECSCEIVAAEDCVEHFHEFYARFCRRLRALFGPWTFIKLGFSDGSFELGLVNFGSFVEYTSQNASLP
jgi:hypothetical protein